MKKVIAIIVLLATVYMVVADGLMIHFDLERSHQYVFNFAAIFLILPFSIFTLFDFTTEEEAKS